MDELHERGRDGARLYGDDPEDGVGGNGAFFLLLDEPEVYGLPPDPVGDQARPAGDVADAGVAAAVLAGVAAPSRAAMSPRAAAGASGGGAGAEPDSYYGRHMIKEPMWKTGRSRGTCSWGHGGWRLRRSRWVPGRGNAGLEKALGGQPAAGPGPARWSRPRPSGALPEHAAGL